MIKLHRQNRQDIGFVIFCAAFFVLTCLFSVWWFRFYLNPDASSYFTLATKYAHFDIRHAVNGYWGPLFSWLLVPAVWVHANLIIAARIILTAAATGILITVYQLLRSRSASRLVAMVASIFLAILLFEQVTAESITPDLLMVLFVLLFALLLESFLAKPSSKVAALLGLDGALLYFTKGFGFYLFIAVTIAVGLWQWWQERDLTKIIKRYIPIAAVFLVLSGPFIGAISIKYHKLTINTAGAFDHNLYGPVAQGVAYPMLTMGPLAPPNRTAASVWEDPTKLTPLIPDAGWSPLTSAANFRYFAKSVFGRNLNAILKFILTFSPVIALGLVLAFVGALSKTRYRRDFAVMALITTMMVLGYSLVYVDSRYLWTLEVFAVISLGLCLSVLERKKLINMSQIIVGTLLVYCLTLLTIGQTIGQLRNLQLPQLKTQTVQAYRMVPTGAHLISDTFDSFRACYFLQLQCYDVLAPPAAISPTYYQLLKQQGINYYADYHTRTQDTRLQQFVRHYFTKIDEYQISGQPVTIYRLN